METAHQYSDAEAALSQVSKSYNGIVCRYFRTETRGLLMAKKIGGLLSMPKFVSTTAPFRYSACKQSMVVSLKDEGRLQKFFSTACNITM